MSEKDKKKKCKKYVLVDCDSEGAGDNFDSDELKTVDIAVNSKKTMRIMNNYFNKYRKKPADEED